LVTAVASGSTNLVATIEGKSAERGGDSEFAPLAPVAAVAVTLASPAFSTWAEQTAGNRDTHRRVRQHVDGPAKSPGSVLTAPSRRSSSSGLVTASGGGTVAIVAQSGSATGSASLSVNTPTAAPVARVTMSVPTQDLEVGHSIQEVLTLYDAA
jgi:hypothetical protein